MGGVIEGSSCLRHTRALARLPGVNTPHFRVPVPRHSRGMSSPCVRQGALGSGGGAEQRTSARLKALEQQVAAAQAAAQAAEQAAARAEQRSAKLEAQVAELRKQLEQALKAGAVTLPPVEATPRASYPAALAPGPVPRSVAPDSGFESLARPEAPSSQPAASRRNAAAMAEEAAMRLIQTLNAPQSPGLAPLPLTGGSDPTPAAQRAAEALARARERIHRNAEGGVTPSEATTRGSALLSASKPY